MKSQYRPRTWGVLQKKPSQSLFSNRRLPADKNNSEIVLSFYLGVPGIIGVIIGVLAGLRVVEIFVNNHQQIAAGPALLSVTFIIIGAVLDHATSLIIKDLLKIQAHAN